MAATGGKVDQTNIGGSGETTQDQNSSTNPHSLQELTNLIQNLLQQTQDRFQTMSDQIIKRIDDMGKRIDDLENQFKRPVRDLRPGTNGLKLTRHE